MKYVITALAVALCGSVATSAILVARDQRLREAQEQNDKAWMHLACKQMYGSYEAFYDVARDECQVKIGGVWYPGEK